jgi:preprotein translocase subunit SecA
MSAMQNISQDYRLTSIKPTPEILKGLDAAVYKWFGSLKRGPKVRDRILNNAATAYGKYGEWSDVSDRRLRDHIQELKIEVLRSGNSGSANLISRALAPLAEVAYRTIGLKPYMVQLAGSIALYEGYIAEMATGEGKTLTAALTATIRGWSGRPCHVVTANDYLAERDASKLEPFYNFCGVTVGSVLGGMEPPKRREGYGKDITYSTAKEITADFLRDRLALGRLQTFEQRQIHALFGGDTADISGVVTRGMHTAIIDEADSLLIDEAVTPLIIARNQPNEVFEKACLAASAVAQTLEAGKHYTVDRQYKEITVLPTVNFDEIDNTKLQLPKKFTGTVFQRELVRQALTAREFFIRDKNYVIHDDKVVIVDDFTGRTMEQRSWSDGLHQLVEAKEGLPITPPNETLARMSFQRYFRFYRNLSGMTGTAQEAASELWHIYGLPVLTIPSNKPSKRKTENRTYFVNQKSKYTAIVEEVRRMNKIGRPVLLGTRSVKTSEELATLLAESGLSCRIINAVRHKEEAAIVALAGTAGAITVATNMAGRGTDIILDRKVEELGGLHVIAAECNESGRIDRQLFGRCARQGDRGSAHAFVCMEDDLLRRFLQPHTLSILTTLIRTGHPLACRVADRLMARAQNTAQRRAYQGRQSVQRMDTWLKDSLSFSHGEM